MWGVKGQPCVRRVLAHCTGAPRPCGNTPLTCLPKAAQCRCLIMLLKVRLRYRSRMSQGPREVQPLQPPLLHDAARAASMCFCRRSAVMRGMGRGMAIWRQGGRGGGGRGRRWVVDCRALPLRNETPASVCGWQLEGSAAAHSRMLCRHVDSQGSWQAGPGDGFPGAADLASLIPPPPQPAPNPPLCRLRQRL